MALGVKYPKKAPTLLIYQGVSWKRHQSSSLLCRSSFQISWIESTFELLCTLVLEFAYLFLKI